MVAVQASLGHGWPTPEFMASPRWFGVMILVWTAAPLLNALTDTVSWLVSRALAADLRRSLARPEEHSLLRLFWKIAWHLVLDLSVAIGLLFATVLLIHAAFDLWNDYLAWLGYPPDQHLVLDLDAVTTRPFTDGLWYWLMLITSLIPTLLHLGMLCTSVLGFAWLTSAGLRADIEAAVGDRREALLAAAAGDREAMKRVPAFPDRGDARKLARLEMQVRPAALVAGTLLAVTLAGVVYLGWTRAADLPSLPHLVIQLQEGGERAREVLPDDYEPRRWPSLRDI